MLKDLYTSLMGNTTVSLVNYLIPIICSLLLGFLFALAYKYKTRSSKSFIATLAILPSVVCVVIMAVNGNIGAGVAVAGAFSLVRFRSAPGSAKEISALFISMATGLLCGMGFVIYAAIFVLIMCLVMIALSFVAFGEDEDECRKSLSIAIPENMNYSSAFDEEFNKFTTSHRLLSTKTSGMGSIFRLTYEITLKDLSVEKELIDALRCKNGNLEISCSTKMPKTIEEL